MAGKRYQQALAAVDRERAYSPLEGVRLLKSLETSRFDETVEVHMRLGGNEGADKCAWRFGPAIGSTPTGSYNQVIDTRYYWLQEEWSNARSGCVQRGV